nr:restriction endonuclease subunit S [Xanthomonas sp. A2111]
MPVGWVETTIGEICAMGPKSAWDDGMEIGFVPMSHAPTNFRGQLNYEARRWHEIKKAYTHFENDDVIFAKVTPCFENGKAALVAGLPNGAGAGSSEFHVLRRRDAGISPSYLLAVIKSAQFLREGEENMTGAVGLRRVPRAFVENFPVRLPPEAEQKRIAQKLDELLAQVDTLKARIDAITALLKRFRQSTLAAAFSARLTGEAPAEFDHWQEAKFSSVIEDLRYGTAQKCDYNGGTTGVLRIPNIGDRGIVLSDMKSSDFSETEIKKLELMKGDIVLIRSNGSVELVGKSAVVSEKEQGLLFAGYLIRIRVDQARSIPEFVNYWLKSPAIRQVIEQIARSTSGVNNINSDEIKSLTFTFPSLSAQAEIVRRVEQLFACADQLEAKVATVQQRIDGLTQSLLAKAFSGELVPQNPSDEPASVLLERVRAQRPAAPKPKRGRKKV